MTKIKYNTEEDMEDMTKIHHTDEEMEYPTEEEMEAMYEEFLKSGSLHEFFDDDPF